MNNGWIKLHRSLLDWEWYSDMNVRVVFIHCLLKANCKDIRYKGKDILRGSFATGLHLLSKEVGLTVAQIRVTLNKLKMTNDIAIKTSAEGSIISVTNYNQYQGNDKPNDKPIASEMTNESQTNDKPIATNKNIKNEKKERINTYTEDFEIFWSDYCRPEGKGSKPNAFKEWKKLTNLEKDYALENILLYKKSQKETQYMAHAERYLKGRLWEGLAVEETKPKKFRPVTQDDFPELYGDKNGN